MLPLTDSQTSVLWRLMPIPCGSIEKGLDGFQKDPTNLCSLSELAASVSDRILV
jgi:hypothetical protein